jgi:hypothetical protein
VTHPNIGTAFLAAGVALLVTAHANNLECHHLLCGWWAFSTKSVKDSELSTAEKG